MPSLDQSGALKHVSSMKPNLSHRVWLAVAVLCLALVCGVTGMAIDAAAQVNEATETADTVAAEEGSQAAGAVDPSAGNMKEGTSALGSGEEAAAPAEEKPPGLVDILLSGKYVGFAVLMVAALVLLFAQSSLWSRLLFSVASEPDVCGDQALHVQVYLGSVLPRVSGFILHDHDPEPAGTEAVLRLGVSLGRAARSDQQDSLQVAQEAVQFRGVQCGAVWTIGVVLSHVLYDQRSDCLFGNADRFGYRPADLGRVFGVQRLRTDQFL